MSLERRRRRLAPPPKSGRISSVVGFESLNPSSRDSGFSVTGRHPEPSKFEPVADLEPPGSKAREGRRPPCVEEAWLMAGLVAPCPVSIGPRPEREVS